MAGPGNIDLTRRPVVQNADGSISTVRSIGVNVDGKELLIPTVAEDGSRVLSDKEAIQQYLRTGKHLGEFDSPEASTAYAKQLHEHQANLYAPNQGTPMKPPVAYMPDGTPIADDQLAQAVASKQARFARGVPVTMRNPAGEVVEVPSEQAWDAIQKGGQPLTSAEVEQRRSDQASEGSYGDLGLAIAHGAANTVGLGLPDVIGAKEIPGYREKVQQLERTQPFGETVGRVGGLAIPVAGELGWGGRAIKALGAPLNALSSVARAGGRAIGELAPEGLGRAALGGVATGAIEGGAWGAGETAQQHAIYDTPLTADRIYFNGILGGVIGGGLGVLSHAAPKLMASRRGAATGPALEEGEGVFGTAREPIAPSLNLGQRAQSTFDDVAIAQTIKSATGATGYDMARLTRLGGKETLSRLATRIADELPTRAGTSLAESADLLGAMRRQAGQDLEGLTAALDQQGVRISNRELVDAARQQVLNPLRESGLKANRDIAERLERDFLSELDASVTSAQDRFEQAARLEMNREVKEAGTALYGEMRALDMPAQEAWKAAKTRLNELLPELQRRAYAAAHVSTGGVERMTTSSVAEAQNLRREFDKFLMGKRDVGRAQLSLKEQRVLDLRNAIQQNIHDQIVGQTDSITGRLFRQTNERYRDWALLEPIARKRYGSRQGERWLGLGEQLHGAGAAIAGSIVAGPIGLLAGVPSAVMHHVGKSVQASRFIGKFARSVAGEMSTMRHVSDIATQAATESGINAEKVASTISRKAFTPTTAKRDLASKIAVGVGRAAMSVRDVINNLKNSQNILPQSVAMSQLAEHPELMHNMAAIHAGARQLLIEEMPKPLQPYNPVLGENQPSPNEALMREYADLIGVVNHPASAIDAFKNGKLNRKHVEVLGRLAPLELQKLQTAALKELSNQAQKGKLSPYQTRLKTSILVGAPVDPTEAPAYVQTVQNFYQQTQPRGSGAGAGARRAPRSGNSGYADRRSTPTERIEQR